MSRLSNLPTRTLARMVYEAEVGSPEWILYKGTLLHRRWSQQFGVAAANEMHAWWYAAWHRQDTPCEDEPEQLQLG